MLVVLVPKLELILYKFDSLHSAIIQYVSLSRLYIR